MGGLLGRLRAFLTATRRTAFGEVVFDAEKITLRTTPGQTQTLWWRDVVRIAYQTTDAGPWFDDHFLVFQQHDLKLFHVSLEWTGALALADHVHQLPDTQLGKLGTLANCTERQSVVVWPSRDAGRSLDAFPG